MAKAEKTEKPRRTRKPKVAPVAPVEREIPVETEETRLRRKAARRERNRQVSDE